MILNVIKLTLLTNKAELYFGWVKNNGLPAGIHPHMCSLHTVHQERKKILKSPLNSFLLVYSKPSLTNNLLLSYLHHVLAN